MTSLNTDIRKLPKPVLLGLLAVAGLVLLFLATIFGTQLYTKIVAFRVTVTPSEVEEGGKITVRWPLIKERQNTYPFERLAICRLPVTRSTLAKKCRVVVASTPNDGQEVLTVSAAPGSYKVLVQALDRFKRPIPNILQLSNRFTVTARSEGGSDGGGGGGGSGDGGGGAPPPPPPAPGPHGGAPPPAPPPGPY